MQSLMNWLTSTPVSSLMIDSAWSWPIAESVHFLGLTLMAGTVGAFDLRLLGVARGIPPAALHKLLRYGIGGFALSVTTGFMFISGTPDQYFYNYAFWFKSVCLVAMGINVALFYSTGFATVKAMGPGDDAPVRLKWMAGVSLVLLAGVMLGGRMLTFFRPPY